MLLTDLSLAPSGLNTASSQEVTWLPAQGGAQDNTACAVLYSGPPRRRASVAPELKHLTPSVEALLALPIPMETEPRLRQMMVAVIRFLALNGREIRAPYVSVARDGALRLEWVAGETDVEIEFYPDGTRVVMIDRDGDVATSDDTSTTDPLLAEALSIVTAGT